MMVGLMALLFTATGQFYHGGLYSSFYMPRTEYTADSAGNIRFIPGDIGFSMQVGTGLAGNFKGSASFSTFVSPALAYNISPRFRIKTGVTVFNNFGDPYIAGYDHYYSPVVNSGTTTSVYVQGDYLLSNKLMLSGAAYKDIPVSPRIADPTLKMPESQGMILNLNYRPTSNFEINASFEYGSGSRSMFYNPIHRGGMFPGIPAW